MICGEAIVGSARDDRAADDGHEQAGDGNRGGRNGTLAGLAERQGEHVEGVPGGLSCEPGSEQRGLVAPAEGTLRA